jgi:GC-rich sequence DNA-binding factor
LKLNSNPLIKVIFSSSSSLFSIESLDEVHRRHQSDADRASDELFSAQSEIERLGHTVPELTARHRSYQELRGYVTDLVECFDEKVGEDD